LAKRAAKNQLLIMLDLDDLQNINDTYGHQEGDRAILSISIGVIDFKPSTRLSSAELFAPAGADLTEQKSKKRMSKSGE